MSDKVAFNVTAKDPTSEIFLIDGDFHLVDRGIGSKKFEVPPGIYKIKQRAANITSEKLYVVRAGMKDIELEHVLFASPMPLNDTVKTHEYHQAAARDACGRVDDAPGAGSAILVVVRDWTSSDHTKVRTENIPDPSQGLRLRDFAGNEIADLEKRAQKNLGPEPCATYRVLVNPGNYRLTLDRPDGTRVEQTIIASNGWETQVFLLLEHAKGHAPCADLVHGAITMVPHDSIFNPSSEDLRAEELVRLSLAEGLTVLPEALRNRAMNPNASPMLALLGAHVIIREARNAKEKNAAIDNTGEVKTIVQNLRAMLGDHPDVEAIAIRAGARNDKYVFTTPPMLRESWASLLRASVEIPELIPAQSFCARIADRIWGDGPWTLWADPDQAAAPGPVWHSSATMLLQNLSAARPAEAPKESNFVKQFFTKRSRRAFPSGREATRGAATTKVDVQQARDLLRDPNKRKEVVRRLGIPISSVNEWLNKLEE